MVSKIHHGVVLPFIGLTVLSFAGSSNVMLQRLSPEDVRGRALPVFAMIILGLVPAGSLRIGSVGFRPGLPHTISGAGILALLIVVWIYATHKTVREV